MRKKRRGARGLLRMCSPASAGGGGGGLSSILENLEYYGDASNADSCDGVDKWMDCLITPQSGAAQSDYYGTPFNSPTLNGTAGDPGTGIDWVNGSNNARIDLTATTFMDNIINTGTTSDWTMFFFFKWQSSTGHLFSNGGNSTSGERGISIVQYGSSSIHIQVRYAAGTSGTINIPTSSLSLSDGEDVMVVVRFDTTTQRIYVQCKGVEVWGAYGQSVTAQLTPTFGIRADSFGDMGTTNYLYAAVIEASFCDTDTIAAVKSHFETAHSRTYDGGL